MKQKDYEYIIKQDKQLEHYQTAYNKLSSKYGGKYTFLVVTNVSPVDMKGEV